MTEKTLRKYHGTLGAILSFFLFIQIGSGTIIAFSEMLGRGRHANPAQADGHLHDAGRNDQNHEENLLQIIHHHGTQPFQALRMLLGIGTLAMILSGATIYVISRKREKPLPKYNET